MAKLLAFTLGALLVSPTVPGAVRAQAVGRCWECLCAIPGEGRVTELCSDRSISSGTCAPCPPGSIGPLILVTTARCEVISSCEGKILNMNVPALSPPGLAGAVMAFLAVGVLGLTRRRKC